jgi:N-dimethylarginine dimethylaminohydrolase
MMRATLDATRSEHRAERYTPRRVLMCAPEHFDVVYDINPWMHKTLESHVQVERRRAERQWDRLVDVYRSLGHEVELVDPAPGQVDMVFSANAATVIDGKVLTARFRHKERRGEEPHFLDWFRARVTTGALADVRVAESVNEGEGDFALVGDLILAGHGFRTSRAAHDEASRFFERPTLSLHLVDSRYYHLDTALAVLSDDLIAWYPPAFDAASRAELRQRFPDAIVAADADASLLGLNMMSDGYHVVMPAGADGLAAQLRSRGFEPVPVELSELRKAGGSVKCCTLEIRS